MDEVKGISNVRRLVRNSMVCPDGHILISRHVHDYRTHVDANGDKYMVDGGNDYLRRSINNIPAVDTSLYTDEPHEVLRKEITWGRRTKTGLVEYIAIRHMSRAHITNIIADGYTGSYVDVMIAEINWRDDHETVSEAKRLEIQRENGYG